MKQKCIVGLLAAVFGMITLLSSCGSGDPGFVRLGDYEGDVGEAAVRHLLPKLPDLAKEVPKEYCLMLARDLRPASMGFIKRFTDTGLTFVHGDALTIEVVTHVPKNPRSGLTPYVIQIAMMHKEADGAYSVEMGWSYKQTAERQHYILRQVEGKWSVTKEEPIPMDER